MSNIRPTSCEACIFATWDNKKQKGCKLNRITKLVDNGARLEQVTTNDKTYYVIHDRVCNACHDINWARQYPKRKWIDLVNERIKIQCDVIIFTNENNTLADLEISVRSANEQTIKPKSIIIIVDYDYTDTSIEEVLECVKANCDVPWKVEHITKEASPLEEAFRSVRGIYYAVFHAGKEIDENFIHTLNYAINEDMIIFLAIEPDQDNNGMVIQSHIHKMLAGNKGGGILEKIKFVCEEQKNDFLVRKFENL